MAARVTEISFREWRNLSDPQWAAIQAMFSRKRARVLAGGSGYGGKSYMLRAAAVYLAWAYARAGFPGQAILFASKSYTVLRKRHFKKFQEEYGHIGRLVTNHGVYGSCFIFNDPKLGVIIFSHAQNMRADKGVEYAAGIYDETTELEEEELADLLYMIRKPGLPWNPLLTASNPDGLGFGHVRDLWRPHLPPEERVKPFSDRVDKSGKLDPADFIYVGFLPSDNPVLQNPDGSFDEAAFYALVAKLPKHIQEARRWGRWNSAEGARWPMLMPETHLFRMKDRWHGGLPLHMKQILSVDYGLDAPYAGLWHAIDEEDNVWTWQEDYQRGLLASDQIKRLQRLTPSVQVRDPRGEIVETFRLSEFVGDPAMFSNATRHMEGDEDRPTVAGIYKAGVEDDERFECGFSAGPRGLEIHKMATLDQYLQRDNGHPDWWIEEGCVNLWSELTGAVFEPGTLSEKISKKCPVHAVDAAVYAMHKRALTGFKRKDTLEDAVERVNARAETLRAESAKKFAQKTIRKQSPTRGKVSI